MIVRLVGQRIHFQPVAGVGGPHLESLVLEHHAVLVEVHRFPHGGRHFPRAHEQAGVFRRQGMEVAIGEGRGARVAPRRQQPAALFGLIPFGEGHLVEGAPVHGGGQQLPVGHAVEDAAQKREQRRSLLQALGPGQPVAPCSLAHQPHVLSTAPTRGCAHRPRSFSHCDGPR